MREERVPKEGAARRGATVTWAGLSEASGRWEAGGGRTRQGGHCEMGGRCKAGGALDAGGARARPCRGCWEQGRKGPGSGGC